MLTRSTEVSPQSDYYSDSLLKVPSVSSSIFNNLAIGVATPIIALNMMNEDFAKKPEGQAMMSAVRSVELENETPGMSTSQWLLAQGSNMLGQALNPISWGLAETGGLASKGLIAGAEKVAPDAATVFMRKPIKDLIAQPVSKYIPEMIGKEGSEKTLSLGLFSEHTLNNFGVFAGAGLPQSIIDNFNNDTGHIAWGGVARSMGEMGAFGMAIGSIPFGWGVLRGKVNRGLGREPTEPVDAQAINDAFEKGHITEKEHQLFHDFLDLKNHPEDVDRKADVEKRFTQIINDNGHRANAVSNEAMMEILTPDDMSNLHGVIADQLASNLPEDYRQSLSNFIIHGRLDYIRRDPKTLDGVRGYVDYINERLANKNPKLAEADAILDKHLLRGTKENMPFSQKELFKMMKKSQFESSHLKHFPVTIPENLTRHVKIQEKIHKLRTKIKNEARSGKEPNKQTVRRVEQLESSTSKIQTPKEELTQLRESLLKGGLIKNFERTAAYHRLLDLSNVWHNARTLLDRIHLEHEYNKQTAFRDLAHEVLKIADSNMPKMAKPENVLDYMRRRLAGNSTKPEPIGEVKNVMDESKSIPTDDEEVLKAQKLELDKSKAKGAKEDFTKSADKYKEFKKSENIFKNFMQCVLGGLNA